MDKQTNVIFRTCIPAEQPILVEFIWSMREEFHLTDHSTVREIIALLFTKGGVVAGFAGEKVVGLFGYFHGDPSQDYTDQAVGFVYIAGIAKAYRRTKAFRNGLYVLVKTLHSMGITEMRCHAAVEDPYTNRLYSRLGTLVRQENNRRGLLCNVYATSIENLLAITGRGSCQRRQQPMPDHTISG